MNSNSTYRLLDKESTWSLILGLLCGSLLIASELGQMIRGLYVVVAAVAVGAVACLTAVPATWFLAKAYRNPMRSSIWPILAAVLACCIIAFHDAITTVQAGELNSALIHLALFITIAGTFVVCSYPLARSKYVDSVGLMLTVALTIYVLTNLVAYSMGIRGRHGDVEFAQAIDNTITERMIAPFGAGLNNYGNIATLCACTGLILFRYSLISRWLVGLWAGSLALTVGAVAAFLVQIRSAAIAILFAIVWAMPLGWGVRRFLIVAVPVAAFALPALYTELLFRTDFPTWIAGNFSRFSRSESDMGSLGNRLYVWNYGLDLLFGGGVPWNGVGQFDRDMAPAVVDATGIVPTGKFTCHNGGLEFLVVYGPVFGVLLLILTCWIYYSLGKCPSGQPFTQKNAFLEVGILLSCISCTAFETFSTHRLFWGIVLSILLARCFRDRPLSVAKFAFADMDDTQSTRKGFPAQLVGMPNRTR